MKWAAIIFSLFLIVGCATRLVVIEQDSKGTFRTIEAEDYSVKILSPDKKTTLVAVPSRWLTPNFVSEIFKGVIGWQSIIPAVVPTPSPTPSPIPVPTPTPYPVPVPTPTPVPIPTPVPTPVPIPSTVFSQFGNVITLDMNNVPGAMRAQGWDSSDNGLYYALAYLYAIGTGEMPDDDAGTLAPLNNQATRDAIATWFDGEVMKVHAQLKNNPNLSVIAITNDGWDRLGFRLGPAIVNRLSEFGGRVTLGEVIPESDYLKGLKGQTHKPSVIDMKGKKK